MLETKSRQIEQSEFGPLLISRQENRVAVAQGGESGVINLDYSLACELADKLLEWIVEQRGGMLGGTKHD